MDLMAISVTGPIAIRRYENIDETLFNLYLNFLSSVLCYVLEITSHGH
jgi:hypothetical protein